MKTKIKQLLKDKDFHKTISSHLYPNLNNIAPSLTQFIFQKTFSRHFRSSSTIDQFQQSLSPFVKKPHRNQSEGGWPIYSDDDLVMMMAQR